MNIAGSTIVAVAIDATDRKQEYADLLRADSRAAGYPWILRRACWGSGLGVEAKHSRITPVRPSSGCVAHSLVGEVEGPPLRVDATKIAVLLLVGLFKIEQILENAPNLWAALDSTGQVVN